MDSEDVRREAEELLAWLASDYCGLSSARIAMIRRTCSAVLNRTTAEPPPIATAAVSAELKEAAIACAHPMLIEAGGGHWQALLPSPGVVKMVGSELLRRLAAEEAAAAEQEERAKPITFSAIERLGGKPGPNGNVFWFDKMIGRVEFDGQTCVYRVATFVVKTLESVGQLDDLVRALKGGE